MKGNTEFQGKQKVIGLLNELQIGIGDISEVTEVSTRQLRYWEKKGYIQSLKTKTGQTRKYRLSEVYRILMIKMYLDEGYNLAKAVEKANTTHKQVALLRKFEKLIASVEVTDQENEYGRINLQSTDKKQKVTGVLDESGSYFEVEDK